MADKAIYSVDTVTSMLGTDKVYVNTGNNIKQITKDNLCGNDIKGIKANLSDYGLNNVFDGEFIKGRYNKTTNIVEYNANFLCCKNKISCNSGDKITLKTTKLFNRFFVHFFNSGTYVSTYDGVYMETAGLIDTTIDVPADVDSFIFEVTAHEATTIASYGHIGVYINNQIDVNNTIQSYTYTKNGLTLHIRKIGKIVTFSLLGQSSSTTSAETNLFDLLPTELRPVMDVDFALMDGARGNYHSRGMLTKNGSFTSKAQVDDRVYLRGSGTYFTN